MSNSRFWRVTSALAVAGLFYVGHGLHSGRSMPLPSWENTARAGVGVSNKNSENVFTSSADGKTIYLWQYYGGKPPKYIGQRTAILSK